MYSFSLKRNEAPFLRRILHIRSIVFILIFLSFRNKYYIFPSKSKEIEHFFFSNTTFEKIQMNDVSLKWNRYGFSWINSFFFFRIQNFPILLNLLIILYYVLQQTPSINLLAICGVERKIFFNKNWLKNRARWRVTYILLTTAQSE